MADRKRHNTLLQSSSGSFKDLKKANSLLQGIHNRSMVTLDRKAHWEKGGKCIVCQKKFGLKRRRHHCRFCGKSVCSKHSINRRIYDQSLNEPERICDICEQEIQDDERRRKIEAEIEILKTKYSNVEAIYNSTNKERKTRQARVEEMKERIKQMQDDNIRQEAQLKLQLEQAREKTASAKDHADSLQKALDSTYIQDKKILASIAQVEGEIKEIDEEIGELRERNGQVAEEVRNLNEKLPNCIGAERVQSIACPNCTIKLSDYFINL